MHTAVDTWYMYFLIGSFETFTDTLFFSLLVYSNGYPNVVAYVCMYIFTCFLCDGIFFFCFHIWWQVRWCNNQLLIFDILTGCHSEFLFFFFVCLFGINVLASLKRRSENPSTISSLSHQCVLVDLLILRSILID
jgi:hypothetical protein